MTPTIYPIAEHAHTILTVPGRMSTVHEPQTVRGQLVHRNQTWKSEQRPVKGYGTNGQMTVTICFDDECPFENRTNAEQWQTACNAGQFRIDKIPTAYSEGKTRDLDAARSIAVWPEATDKQLSAPREELTAMLTARLPALIAAFRADMDAIGMLWEPEATP